MWLGLKSVGVLLVAVFIIDLCRRWARNASEREIFRGRQAHLNSSDSSKVETLQYATHPCPAYSINSPRSDDVLANRKCRPRMETVQVCTTARRSYGRVPSNHVCPKLPGRYFANICRFTNDSIRTSDVSHLHLECELELCENSPLYIGTIQPEYGLFTKAEHWHIANTKPEINTMIRKVVMANVKNGFDFCILSCFVKSRSEVIRQALVFPPYLRLTDSTKAEKININLLTLDSVSRQHFYRQLPKTVAAMQQINMHSKAMVLDFELMQSLGPRTFPNMRALFSGAVDVDSEDEVHTYGLSALFSKYTNLGYQTLLQEDSCWFDSWGAIITDNKHDTRTMENVEDYRSKWNEMNTKLRHLPIDSLGLTHFSCEVFLQYGVTNQFNWPPKVCYNGQLLSSYFLSYTTSLLSVSEETNNSLPLFLYTHLNTGHEKTGKRITHSDREISEYVSTMSAMRNTLTILMSDHGPKTSRYSQQYLEGRHEIAHASLFLVIPEEVRTKLGDNVILNLIANQHLLISHVDLFRTLISLHSPTPQGLFHPVSPTRFCHDIPMYSFMSCLCKDSDVVLPDNDENIQWMAEFALGYLNNRISSEFRAAQTDWRSVGYGNCERLVGKRYEKIRQVSSNSSLTFTFDIIVESYKHEEVFEVAVKVLDLETAKTNEPNQYKQKPRSHIEASLAHLPTPRDEHIISNETSSLDNRTVIPGRLHLIRWRRVSIFQHYSKCADPGVDISLCICRKESSRMQNPAGPLSRLLTSVIFNVETVVEFIDSKCLALLIRTRPNVVRNYEITNMCVDRIYFIIFNLKSKSTAGLEIKSAKTLPQSQPVYPWMLHSLTSLTLIGNKGFLSSIEHEVTFRKREIFIS